MSINSYSTSIPPISVLIYSVENGAQPPVNTQTSSVNDASSACQEPQSEWPSLSKINLVINKFPMEKVDPRTVRIPPRGIPRQGTAIKEIKKSTLPTHSVSKKARQILQKYVDLFPQSTLGSGDNINNAPIPYQPAPTPQQLNWNQNQAYAPISYPPVPNSDTRYPPVPNYTPIPSYSPVIPNYPQPLNSNTSYLQAPNYYTPTPSPVIPNYPQPPHKTIAVNVVNKNNNYVVNTNINQGLSKEQRENIERFNNIKVDIDFTKLNQTQFVYFTEKDLEPKMKR